MPLRKKHTLLIAFLSFLATIPTGAGVASASDNVQVEIRVKAAFIYNFARFVEWPARNGPGPVRIGILGRGDLVEPLEEVIQGKSVNGQPIEIRHINTAAEAGHCEILLIEHSESGHVREIAQALETSPVLTVCDEANCLRDGAMIAFRVVDDSVRFQINLEAAEHAGLKISSQLLKVAVPAAGKH